MSAMRVPTCSGAVVMLTWGSELCFRPWVLPLPGQLPQRLTCLGAP